MMIPWVNTMLNAWGKWVRRSMDGGIGWQKCSAMFRDMPASPEWNRSAPPVGVGSLADCEFTDAAVRRLSKEEDRVLMAAIYVAKLPVAEVARRLDVSRTTVYARWECIQRQLIGHMNDITAGVDAH